MHSVGRDETAVANRGSRWASVMVGVDPDPANAALVTEWTKSYHEALHYSAGAAYVNFLMNRDGRSSVRREPPMTVTVADLQAFADAWNRHDAEALMRFVTEDCVFDASAGPDVCGTRYVGKDDVEAGFREVWATFPDAQWRSARHFVCGDRGVSEWTFSGTKADGTRVEVNGCDVFTFRDGRIAIKNSYRKNRPPIAPV